MPRLNPGKLAHPDILSRMEKALLVRWLWPVREHLERRGLRLPAPEGPEPVPGDQLARLLAEPSPDLPAELLESLHLFHELDHPAAMDALRQEALRRGLELGAGALATPLDLVMRAWLLDRDLVQEVHLRLELNRPRSFRYYLTQQDPVPPFDGPTPAQLHGLEQRLNRFYEAWQRGRGARVLAYPRHGEWWFLVRHGAPCRREGAMENDRPATVFYRPQCHDVAVYHPGRGEIRLNCCAERERRALLRAFGHCLFGRADFFPGTAKYTLAPLLRHGRACLACGDLPAIERVMLQAVEFHFSRAPWRRVRHEADDIFQQVETGKIHWPETAEEITEARFEVKLRRGRRPRRLTIVPCNTALYCRDSDSRFLEQFVEARRFAQRGED